MAHHIPPPPPARINPWVQARYGPSRLPVNLNDMPNNYLKILPKFDGENNASVEDHMIHFQDFTDNLFIEYDDVYMRLFGQTLEGDVRKWFKDLMVDSIDSWKTFKELFMRQWGEKRDHLYYLTEFGALKKKNNDVVDIEGNMTASGKIKPRSDSGEKDKKKQKEEGGPSTSYAESQEAKIEEMNKLIRNLSNKLTKLEVGNNNNAPRPPQNMGARNFNPPV
eukprot:Gb_40590 [translate_table: standard]